jgi:hypothetical protein
LLLVLQSFVASSSAWAGCSHLVDSRSDRQVRGSLLDQLIVGANDGLPAGPEAPARRSPCSGLSCSSRDSLPNSAAVPVDGSGAEQACVPGDPSAPVPGSSFARIIEEPVLAGAGEPTSIFHPPRVRPVA